MEGFIEVTLKIQDKKVLVNISLIKDITEDSVICFGNKYFYSVKETYEEIKQLIKEATQPT